MVFSWGNDSKRQGLLGMGNIFEVKAPAMNKDLTLIKTIDISMSEEHCAAIDVCKNLYTWGNGSNGQLGNKNIKMSLVPKKVVLNIPFTVRKTESGKNYTCGITLNSKVFIFGKLEKLLDQYEKGDNLRQDKDITFISLDTDLNRAEEVYVGEKLFAITSSNGKLYLYIEPHGLYQVKLTHQIHHVKFIGDNFYAINTHHNLIYEFIHYSFKNKQFDINDYAEFSYSINSNAKLSLLRSPFYIKVLFFTMYCSDEDKKMYETNKQQLFSKTNTKNENEEDHENSELTYKNESKEDETVSVFSSNQIKINKMSTMLGNIFDKQIETIANKNKSFYSKNNEDYFFYGKKRIELTKMKDTEPFLTGTNNEYKLINDTIKSQKSNSKMNYNPIEANNDNTHLETNNNKNKIYFLDNAEIPDAYPDSYKKSQVITKTNSMKQCNSFNKKQEGSISLNNKNNLNNVNKETNIINYISEGNKQRNDDETKSKLVFNITSNKMPNQDITEKELQIIEIMNSLQKPKPLLINELGKKTDQVITTESIVINNRRCKSLIEKIEQIRNEIKEDNKIETKYIVPNKIERESNSSLITEYKNNEPVELNTHNNKLNITSGHNVKGIKPKVIEYKQQNEDNYKTLGINQEKSQTQNIQNQNDDMNHSFKNNNCISEIKNTHSQNEICQNIEETINRLMTIILRMKNEYINRTSQEFFLKMNYYHQQQKAKPKAVEINSKLLDIQEKDIITGIEYIIPTSNESKNKLHHDNEKTLEIIKEDNDYNDSKKQTCFKIQNITTHNEISYSKASHHQNSSSNIQSNAFNSNNNHQLILAEVHLFTSENRNTINETNINEKRTSNTDKCIINETKTDLKIEENEDNLFNVSQKVKEPMNNEHTNVEKDQIETIRVPKNSILSKTLDIFQMANPHSNQFSNVKEKSIIEKKTMKTSYHLNESETTSKNQPDHINIKHESTPYQFKNKESFDSVKYNKMKHEYNIKQSNKNTIIKKERDKLENNSKLNAEQIKSNILEQSINNSNYVPQITKDNGLEEINKEKQNQLITQNQFNKITEYQVIQDNKVDIQGNQFIKRQSDNYDLKEYENEAHKHHELNDEKKINNNIKQRDNNEMICNIANAQNIFKAYVEGTDNRLINSPHQVKDNNDYITQINPFIYQIQSDINKNDFKNKSIRKDINSYIDNINHQKEKENELNDDNNNEKCQLTNSLNTITTAQERTLMPSSIKNNIANDNSFHFSSLINSKITTFQSKPNQIFTPIKKNLRSMKEFNDSSIHLKETDSIMKNSNKSLCQKESNDFISKDIANNINSGYSDRLYDILKEIKEKPKHINTNIHQDQDQQHERENGIINNTKDLSPDLTILSNDNKQSFNYTSFANDNNKTQSFDKHILNTEGTQVTTNINHTQFQKENISKEYLRKAEVTSLSSREIKPQSDWYNIKSKDSSLLKPTIITSLERKQKLLSDYNSKNPFKGIKSNDFYSHQTNTTHQLKYIQQNNFDIDRSSSNLNNQIEFSHPKDLKINDTNSRFENNSAQIDEPFKSTHKYTSINFTNGLNQKNALKKSSKETNGDQTIQQTIVEKTPFQNYQEQFDNQNKNATMEISNTNSKITFKNQLHSNFSLEESNSRSFDHEKNYKSDFQENQLQFSIKNNEFQINNDNEIKSINSINSIHEAYYLTQSDIDKDEQENVISINTTNKVNNDNKLTIAREDKLTEHYMSKVIERNELKSINHLKPQEGLNLFTRKQMNINDNKILEKTKESQSLILQKNNEQNNQKELRLEDLSKCEMERNQLKGTQNELMSTPKDNNNKEISINQPRVIIVKSKEELLQKLQSEEYKDEESVYYLLEGEDNLTDIVEEEESLAESQSTKKNNSQMIKVKNKKVISITSKKQGNELQKEIKSVIIDKVKTSPSFAQNNCEKENNLSLKNKNTLFKIINKSFDQQSLMHINETKMQPCKNKKWKSLNYILPMNNNNNQIEPLKNNDILLEKTNPTKLTTSKLSKMSYILNPLITNKTFENTNQFSSQYKVFQTNKKKYKKSKTSQNSISTGKIKKTFFIEKLKPNLNEDQNINTVLENKEKYQNTSNTNNFIYPNSNKPSQLISSKPQIENSKGGESNNWKNNLFETPKNIKLACPNDYQLQVDNLKENNMLKQNSQSKIINKEMNSYQTPTFNQFSKKKSYLTQKDNIKEYETPKETQEINKPIDQENNSYMLLRNKYLDFLIKTYGNENLMQTSDKDDKFLHDLVQNKIPIEDDNLESIECSKLMKKFMIHSLENTKFIQWKEKLELMINSSKKEESNELTKSNLLNLIALDDDEDKSNMLEPIELDKSWISISIRKSFVDSLKSSTNNNVIPNLGPHQAIKTVKVELYKGKKNKKQ